MEKKDSSLIIKKSGDGTLVVKEEYITYITLVAHPGSIHVSHKTPNSGKAKDIFEGLIEFCLYHNLDLFCVFGCDGTYVNTGDKEGIIAVLNNFLDNLFNGQFVCCT